jgi:hypothetical protein
MTTRQRLARRGCTIVCLASAAFLAAGEARAQIIDRVLAVVAGGPITLSDVNAAIALGLVPAPAGGTDADRVQPALDAMIERELQLVEVNRYVPPEPTDAEIAARLAEVRARFPSDAAFNATLNETGMSGDQLRAHLRDTLRIESYLVQRFGSAYQPSEEEVLGYYRSHQAEFTRDGLPRPYAEAKDEVRARLIQERAAPLIRDWVAGLRRRVDVTVLPRQ